MQVMFELDINSTKRFFWDNKLNFVWWFKIFSLIREVQYYTANFCIHPTMLFFLHYANVASNFSDSQTIFGIVIIQFSHLRIQMKINSSYTIQTEILSNHNLFWNSPELLVTSPKIIFIYEMLGI